MPFSPVLMRFHASFQAVSRDVFVSCVVARLPDCRLARGVAEFGNGSEEVDVGSDVVFCRRWTIGLAWGGVVVGNECGDGE